MNISLNPNFTYLKSYAPGLHRNTLIFTEKGDLLGAVNSDGTKVLESILKNQSLKKIRQKKSLSDEFESFLSLLKQMDIIRQNISQEVTYIDPKNNPSFKINCTSRKFISKFYDYISSVFYPGSPQVDTYNQFSTSILKYLPQSSSSANLLAIDVGSGSGFYTGLLRKYGMKTISADASLGRLKLSRKRISNNKNQVACLIESLPFKSDTFDFLLCLFVLEHVLDLSSSINEIMRVVKRNGNALIAIPFLSLKSLIKTIFKRNYLELGHFRIFGIFRYLTLWCASIKSLISLIKKNGGIINCIETKKAGREREEYKFKYLSKIIKKIFPYWLSGEQAIIYLRKR